jgi:hypothetical protein
MELDAPKVVVTGREIEQPVTDLPRSDFDFLCQRALSWHEAGHVLYTAYDHFRDELDDRFTSADKGFAKEIWNALEDGAIELQLTRKWSNSYGVMRAERANMKVAKTPAIRDPENSTENRDSYLHTMSHAIFNAIMGTWEEQVYDLEAIYRDALYDENDMSHHFLRDNGANDREIFMENVKPLIDDVVPKVLSTADPKERNNIIFDFVEDVIQYVDQAQAGGKEQMDRQDGQSANGSPDDASESHSGEAQELATELEDVDPDDLQPADVDPDDVDDVTEIEVDDDVQREMQKKVREQKMNESGMTDDTVDDLEDWTEALRGEEGIASDKIEFPTDDPEANADTYERARGNSRALARVFENRLQREQRSKVKRHQRRGRYTGRGGSTLRAVRGEREIKERVIEPDDKDYNFMFILDRSGSMSGKTVEEAEVALGTLGLALEDVGASTAVLDLYSSEAQLAKTLNTPMDQAKNRVFNGKACGGTPLTETVQLAKERLVREDGNNIMVVITDGCPGNADRFETAVQSCPMPVVGVSLTDMDSVPGESVYDRSTTAVPGSDLQQVLMDLAREVMF